MSSQKRAKHKQSEIVSFSRSYRTALQKGLLDSETPPDPVRLRRLGNRAAKLGIDLLGLARIHESSLTALETASIPAREKRERTRRGTAFFDLVLAPIEESRFIASEANTRFETIIETLTRRTEALDKSNKKLQVEIIRRKDVENSLRTSEATTSLLLKQAQAMQEQMRSLSHRLITAQEDERRRISRELHDIVAQILAAINVQLAVLRSQSSADLADLQEKISVTERLVEQSVEIVHRFAAELRPVVLDDLGLIPALRSYIDSFTDHYDIPVQISASPTVEELDSTALTTIFRIAQEALTNIARHSQASLVKFTLRPTKRSFRMKIADNGLGFSTTILTTTCDYRRLGILGMRERAEMVGGSFRIDSTDGEGTVILVDIPRPSGVPADLSQIEPTPGKPTKKTT